MNLNITAQIEINRLKKIINELKSKQEIVAWQYRWQMDDSEDWLTWCNCSEEDYLAYQVPDMFKNIVYETRKLYTLVLEENNSEEYERDYIIPQDIIDRERFLLLNKTLSF